MLFTSLHSSMVLSLTCPLKVRELFKWTLKTLGWYLALLLVPYEQKRADPFFLTAKVAEPCNTAIGKPPNMVRNDRETRTIDNLRTIPHGAWVSPSFLIGWSGRDNKPLTHFDCFYYQGFHSSLPGFLHKLHRTCEDVWSQNLDTRTVKRLIGIHC